MNDIGASIGILIIIICLIGLGIEFVSKSNKNEKDIYKENINKRETDELEKEISKYKNINTLFYRELKRNNELLSSIRIILTFFTVVLIIRIIIALF